MSAITSKNTGNDGVPEEVNVKVPSNEDFASEVKSDRLKILYQITLVFCVTFLMILLTFGAVQTSRGPSNLNIVAGLVFIMVGCGITHVLLQRNRLDWAVYTYALSGCLGVGVFMYWGEGTILQIVPFLLPIIVFIVGLLLSPLSAFMVTLLAAVIAIFAPVFGSGTAPVAHQFFAVFLMLLSWLLAAQVTGELYQITEWALGNYQRERRTNDELFDKRRELQMSLKRAEALADRLKDINSELDTARQAAEEAKTFRGKFLANMSHELRTPLNAIIGFSETMLQFPIMYDNTPLPAAYEKDLGQIYNSGRQLLHVINDILDLAKVDAGKLEVHMGSVDPKPIVAAAISTAKGLLGSKPVRLEQDPTDELPLVWADETRLRQVLLNLYSNACKYTDQGMIRLLVKVRDDEVEFGIKDTGLGIDAEYHDKLFKEFQQAKTGGRDPRSGSGLGLAISKQLLDLMGGRIWMESEVGKGSTFYFTVKRQPAGEKKQTGNLQSAAVVKTGE